MGSRRDAPTANRRFAKCKERFMPVPGNATTNFLNVDLDLRARNGLDDLLKYLDQSVVVLNHTAHDASVELNKENASLEETLVNIIELVESLPPSARSIWTQCEFRRMNIGIQAGNKPHAALFTISSNTISLLARLQCEITFTVYSSADRTKIQKEAS
jgi:hypothetical protein